MNIASRNPHEYVNGCSVNVSGGLRKVLDVLELPSASCFRPAPELDYPLSERQ
jgi:hypothetical protein